MASRVQTVILAGISFLAGVVLGRCTAPRDEARPQPQQPRHVEATSSAIATSSASTVGKQTIRVTIPRETRPGAPKRRVLTSQGTTTPPDEENAPPIVIELEQTMAATASSATEATASASVAIPDAVDAYPRVGVLIGTMPGGVALDLELAQVHGFGVDLEGNAQQFGVGVSWGDRVFAEAGGFMTYDLSPGVFVGLGARW